MGEKKRKAVGGKLLRSFRTRSFRVGSYSIISALLVIAIAVAVVLAAGQLPVKYTQFDMTSQGIYSLSEQTKQLCAGLSQDVTIYWMVQTGSEDNQLKSLLSRYEELSDRIEVTQVDPVEYPNFAATYTDDLQYNNSLIVVSGGRNKFLDYYDIFLYDYTGFYTTGSVDVTFNGESALTGAIDYVTGMDLPKLYTLSGHGEDSLPSDVSTAIKNQNILTEELSLLVNKSVPEDCSCLLIYSPASDISSEEKTIVQDYLGGGGRMLLITDYSREEMPNLMALMSNYGTTLNKGMVVDSDTEYNLRGYRNLLLPKVVYHEITKPIQEGRYRVLLPNAQGITVDSNLRSGLSVTQLLKTSDESFSKLAGDQSTSTEFEVGDINGPFALGVAIKENDTRIVWFTTSLMLDSSTNVMVAGANWDLFINSINWMSERTNRISISAKSYDSSVPLTVPTAEAAKISILAIGVVPLAILALGLTIVIRRRRR